MTEVSLTVPVVISECYGMFGLSDEACVELAARKGWWYDRKTALFHSNHNSAGPKGTLSMGDIARNDRDLIAVVEGLGPAANRDGAKLKVQQVKVTINIDTHDGYERIVGAGAYAPFFDDE